MWRSSYCQVPWCLWGFAIYVPFGFKYRMDSGRREDGNVGYTAGNVPMKYFYENAYLSIVWFSCKVNFDKARGHHFLNITNLFTSTVIFVTAMNSKQPRRITRSLTRRVLRSEASSGNVGRSGLRSEASSGNVVRSGMGSQVTSNAVRCGRAQVACDDGSDTLSYDDRSDESYHTDISDRAKERAKNVGLEHVPITRVQFETDFAHHLLLSNLVCHSCHECFDFVDPNNQAVPEQCPSCEDWETMGRPRFCRYHKCVWNDRSEECYECDEERQIWDPDY